MKPTIPLKPDAFMRIQANGSPLFWAATASINVVLALSPMTWIRVFFFPYLRRHAHTVTFTKVIVDVYVGGLLAVETVTLCFFTQPGSGWTCKALAIFGLVDVVAATLRDLIVASSLHSDDDGPYILVQDPIRWLVMMPLSVMQVIVCFAILYLSYGSQFEGVAINTPLTAIYYSLVTFTTLGYGEITPKGDSRIGQILISAQLVASIMFLLGKLPIAVAITRVRGGGGATS